MDVETIDLGLTPEEDKLNNFSPRDPQLVNQEYVSTEGPTASLPKEADISVTETQALKKRRVGDAGDVDSNPTDAAEASALEDGNKETPEEQIGETGLDRRIRNRPKSSVTGMYKVNVARPLNSMKGHTAFLTFAIAPLEG